MGAGVIADPLGEGVSGVGLCGEGDGCSVVVGVLLWVCGDVAGSVSNGV